MPIKWDEAKPAEKLLGLYTALLMSPRATSLADLAGILGCSKQTVSRLIRQLMDSRLGEVRCMRQGREVCYALAKPKRLPNICLNAEGLTQMALCMDFLGRLLPQNMQKAMLANWAHMSQMAPEGSDMPVAGMGASLTKGHIDYEPFEQILQSLIQAIRRRRICRITYRSQRHKDPKVWHFAPQRLLSYRECIYVAGHMVPDGGEHREPLPMQLPLQRFMDCVLTGRSGEKFAHLTLDGDKLGIMSGEPFDVSVRFSPEAATYAAERQWSAQQRLEEFPDGSVVLHVRSQSPEECIAWVLGFGHTAQLLGPDWLVAKLRQRIGAMLAHYPEAKAVE